MNLKVTGSTNKKLLTRRQQMAIQTEKGVTLLLLLKKIFVSFFQLLGIYRGWVQLNRSGYNTE